MRYDDALITAKDLVLKKVAISALMILLTIKVLILLTHHTAQEKLLMGRFIY